MEYTVKTTDAKTSGGRFVVIYLVVSIFIAGGSVISLYPWHPVTWLGWLVLYLAAPPILFIFEWLGEKLNLGGISKKVDPDLSKFSWSRIGFGVITIVPFMIVILAAFYLIADSPNQFIQENFSKEW